MGITNRINFRHVRGDIFGGVTAAVIALPMALAFGVASGAGAASGLYGAVIVGFFAALFGGTPTLISGAYRANDGGVYRRHCSADCFRP
jgi:SulP family sulfate permease